MNTFANALLATSVVSHGLRAYESRDQPGDLCCRFFKEFNFVDPHEQEYCITDPSGFNDYTISDTQNVHIKSAMCGKNVAVDVCNGDPETTEDRECLIMSAGSVTTA